MKLSFRTILVICSILAGAFFQARCSDDSAQSTDNLLDVVEKAQKTIYQKYPDESSIARKMAIEELEKIARSDKTEDERIAAILAKYPDPATKLRQAAEQGDCNAPHLSRVTLRKSGKKVCFRGLRESVMPG